MSQTTAKDVILITGSSGLIGWPLAVRLAQQYQVVGFDREGPPESPPEVDSILVDFSSLDSIRSGLESVADRYGKNIASVIHLAAYYDFSGEPSPQYEEVTVRGTERLLRLLDAREGFKVDQFIFSSTTLVHAPCKRGEQINEDWPLEPKWAYPESKLITEQLVQQRKRKFPYVILRIAGVYDELCHSIPIANQIQRIYERRLTSHVFPGDTAAGQPFIHLEDLIDAFMRLVERRHELPPELVLLLGEPKTLSYEYLQNELGRLIHGEKEWPTRQIPKAIAKTGAWLQDKIPGIEEPFIRPWMIDLADDHGELDITRARRYLGWEPQHSLRETLPKMVDSLQRNPANWYHRNKLKKPHGLEERFAGRKAA